MYQNIFATLTRNSFSRDVKHVWNASFTYQYHYTYHKRYNLSLNTFVRSFPKGIQLYTGEKIRNHVPCVACYSYMYIMDIDVSRLVISLKCLENYAMHTEQIHW